jgi:hypothetical protein
MGKTGTEKSLLKSLEKTPKSRRELKKIVQEKHIKSALNNLCERGEIKKEGKKYIRVVISSEQATTEQCRPSAASVSQTKSIPIAMQMRKEATKKNSVTIMLPQVDIDDEIRRLEAELEKSSSSEGSGDEDDAASDDAGFLSLSKFAKDRIESLPTTALPMPGRYNPRDGMKRAKKKRPAVSSGLREAVKEVLNGYKARSSERLPFYCRVCAKQYDNETEFFNHRSTQFHKTAVDMEKKASYCKMCRKQLTSPDQMKEHLSSRPHRERLQKMKIRQGGQKQQNSGRRQWS